MGTDWRDYVNGADPYMPSDNMGPGFVSPNVEAPQPVTVNPSTGGIQPIKQSGLYAIYNQRNPFSAQAERLNAMSTRDMGGKLGWLPGVVATLQAGKANRQAQDFELLRQKKADEIMARNEAWNKIENDREAQKRELDIFEKEIMPNAFKVFESIYKQAEDYDAAKKGLTQSVNSQVTERKMAMPLFKDIAPMQGGQGAMLWSTKENKAVQGFIDAKGNLGKKNDKNEIIPSDREDMLLSVYNQFNTSDAKADAARDGEGSGGRSNPVLTAIMSEMNNLDRIGSRDELTPEQEARREGLQKAADAIRGVTPAQVKPAPPPAIPEKGFLGRVGDAIVNRVAGTYTATTSPDLSKYKAEAENMLRANKLVVNNETIAKVIPQLIERDKKNKK